MIQRVTNLAFIGFDEDVDKTWLMNELNNPKSPIHVEIQFASNRWLVDYNYVIISVSKLSSYREPTLDNLEVITQYLKCTDPDQPNLTRQGAGMVIGSFFHPEQNSWSHHS